jgi:general control protein GCN4
VPLFHSNSTGNLGNLNSISQYPVPANLDMVGGGNYSPSHLLSASPLTLESEINVAYEGTFGDLGASGAALFANMNDDFDFSHLMGATDGFTPVNGDMKPHGATVSPKDLFNDSIPPSASFTNLTTPGSTFIETPDEEYQTSPLFTDSIGVDGHSADNWYSLFPDDNGPIAQPAPMSRTASASSGHQIVVHPGGEGNRKRSSTATMSPATFSPATKHSTVAGVNARKRDKPLPPIVVDEHDQVALKRARNTAAARKSRAKKVSEREEMEERISQLQDQVDFWKAKALALMNEGDSSDE